MLYQQNMYPKSKYIEIEMSSKNENNRTHNEFSFEYEGEEKYLQEAQNRISQLNTLAKRLIGNQNYSIQITISGSES